MRTRRKPSAVLLKLARDQAGVVTRAQVCQHQRSDKVRRRWAREWTTLAPGYYCMEVPTWHSWCWAALSRAGAGAVVGGAAAGHLYGFVKQQPRSIVVFHAGGRPLSQMGDGTTTVVFRRGERAGRGTPARTSVETAIVDLAGECDEDATVMAATRAVAEGMTTPSRILDAMERRRAVRHRAVLERVCQEASRGIESVLEWRFLELVLLAHGLPLPSRQVRVVDSTRTDNVWEQYGLLVELDGRLGHEETFRDMDRDNRAALQGYTTLRYGWHDVVERPAAVAAQVREALEAGGWRGSGPTDG